MLVEKQEVESRKAAFIESISAAESKTPQHDIRPLKWDSIHDPHQLSVLPAAPVRACVCWCAPLSMPRARKTYFH